MLIKGAAPTNYCLKSEVFITLCSTHYQQYKSWTVFVNYVQLVTQQYESRPSRKTPL